MAISTFDELQAAIANWLDRDDLTDRIPEFIALAEARIGRELRRRTIVSPFTISAGDTSSTLPEDCGELRYARHASASRNCPITFTTPYGLNRFRDLGAGVPEYAAIVNGNLLWNRESDGDYDLELIYFAALEPLSESAPTNADFSVAPDLYLYGALVEATPFLEHDERIMTWESKYQVALTTLNDSRERAELGAAPAVMTLPTVFG